MTKQTFQRTGIWVITVALIVGSLGVYFMIILGNRNDQSAQAQNQDQSQSQTSAQPQPQTGAVDPTAYRVNGKVTQLQITDLKVGDGAVAKASDKVRVQYKGTIAQTGVKFDSSYDKGTPIDIGLDQVIQGWQQGVPGMKVGGKRRLVIPAALGYGAQAQGNLIPANSDLVFEIELLAIDPPAAQ